MRLRVPSNIVDIFNANRDHFRNAAPAAYEKAGDDDLHILSIYDPALGVYQRPNDKNALAGTVEDKALYHFLLFYELFAFENNEDHDNDFQPYIESLVPVVLREAGLLTRVLAIVLVLQQEDPERAQKYANFLAYLKANFDKGQPVYDAAFTEAQQLIANRQVDRYLQALPNFSAKSEPLVFPENSSKAKSEAAGQPAESNGKAWFKWFAKLGSLVVVPVSTVTAMISPKIYVKTRAGSKAFRYGYHVANTILFLSAAYIVLSIIFPHFAAFKPFVEALEHAHLMIGVEGALKVGAPLLTTSAVVTVAATVAGGARVIRQSVETDLQDLSFAYSPDDFAALGSANKSSPKAGSNGKDAGAAAGVVVNKSGAPVNGASGDVKVAGGDASAAANAAAAAAAAASSSASASASATPAPAVVVGAAAADAARPASAAVNGANGSSAPSVVVTVVPAAANGGPGRTAASAEQKAAAVSRAPSPVNGPITVNANGSAAPAQPMAVNGGSVNGSATASPAAAPAPASDAHRPMVVAASAAASPEQKAAAPLGRPASPPQSTANGSGVGADSKTAAASAAGTSTPPPQSPAPATSTRAPGGLSMALSPATVADINAGSTDAKAAASGAASAATVDAKTALISQRYNDYFLGNASGQPAKAGIRSKLYALRSKVNLPSAEELKSEEQVSRFIRNVIDSKDAGSLVDQINTVSQKFSNEVNDELSRKGFALIVLGFAFNESGNLDGFKYAIKIIRRLCYKKEANVYASDNKMMGEVCADLGMISPKLAAKSVGGSAPSAGAAGPLSAAGSVAFVTQPAGKPAANGGGNATPRSAVDPNVRAGRGAARR